MLSLQPLDVPAKRLQQTPRTNIGRLLNGSEGKIGANT